MFARQRPEGFWTFNSVVEDFEFEYIDASLAQAIDGVGAGAYSLENDMVIGKADPLVMWQFQLPVDCYDQLTALDGFVAYGDVTIGISPTDTLTVSAETRFHAFATFDDYALFNSEVVIGDSASNNLTVNATGFFAGETTFDDHANFNNNVYVNDALVLVGDLHFEGGSIITPMGFAGDGKIKFRSKTLTSPGDQSFKAARYDTIFVPTGVMNEGDSLTIDDTDAEDGMRIRFITRDASVGVVVSGPGSLIVPLKKASGFPPGVEFERIAGAWQAFYGDVS